MRPRLKPKASFAYLYISKMARQDIENSKNLIVLARNLAILLDELHAARTSSDWGLTHKHQDLDLLSGIKMPTSVYICILTSRIYRNA